METKGETNGKIEEQIPLQKKEIIHDLSFMEKVQYFRSNITVEPVLFLFIMPSVLSMLAVQNLNLDKTCRVSLGFKDDICLALRSREKINMTLDEQSVHKYISGVNIWKGIVRSIVPFLLVLFIGSWSDKTGKRKICMILPIIGEFVTCIFNIINTYYFYKVSVEWTVFMEIIFTSLTGGWYSMVLGAFSYVGDISSKETRTFRIGVLSMFMTVGFPVGAALSGVLPKYAGLYGAFSVSAILFFINFFYVYFKLDDHTWLADQNKIDRKKTCSSSLLEFFDVKSVRSTFKIVYKKGSPNRRLRICLILLILFLTFGVLKAEVAVKYIFSQYRFNWDEVKFSKFSTYSFITHALGTLFSIIIFSKKFQCDDATLGMIACSSKIAGALMMAFARNSFEAYMSPLLEILDGTTLIALRSIASKLVTYQELGKVFSLFGLIETMSQLIFEPIYSIVYKTSISVLPGAIFLVSAIVTALAFLIFAWFYRQHKNDRKKKRIEDNNLTSIQECS